MELSNTVYANVLRTYNGKATVWEAAQGLDSITVRTDLLYGGSKGFWNSCPIREIRSEPGTVTPEVKALAELRERYIDEPVPLLYDLAMKSIAESWRPDAFHLVFHTSGWDSRIISGAIKALLAENGPDWLGEGLLFLTNRWEAPRFLQVMEAMGWPANQYAVYDNGSAKTEHFAEHAYDMWLCAPFPRPGNFFWYLPAWAEREGLIPSENVQAFTGLWANEVWHAFFPGQTRWLQLVRKKYGCHATASQPIKAQWAEYPLVSLPILDILSQSKGSANSNILRRQVGLYACPEAKRIKPSRDREGTSPISERLRQELDEHYQQTAFGQHREWQVPEYSGSSSGWCRWSSALLIDKLIEGGTHCVWPDGATPG